MEQPLISELHVKSKRGSLHIKKKYPELYSYILKTYPNLGFQEALYVHYYGEPKPCPTCGLRPSFRSFTKGYSIYCSRTCANRNQEKKEGCSQTCLKKYGGIGFASNVIKEKSKQTCIKRYGSVDFQNPEKRKRTNLQKYGSEYPLGSSLVWEKIKRTNLQKYGSEYICGSSIIREKAKKTNKQRYGFENPMKSKKIRDKIISTNLSRLGVPYGFLNSEPGYSKISQEYFKTLDQQHPNAVYATKGGEHRVGPYILDWYDPDSNTCIEFNGDYWHANPKLYDRNWVQPVTHKKAHELWEKDAEKIEYLESQGINVKVVWESEIKFQLDHK